MMATTTLKMDATVRYVARCGDGIVDDGEACDDGNNVDGDGCAVNCVAEAPADRALTSCAVPSVSALAIVLPTESVCRHVLPRVPPGAQVAIRAVLSAC